MKLGRISSSSSEGLLLEQNEMCLITIIIVLLRKKHFNPVTVFCRVKLHFFLSINAEIEPCCCQEVETTISNSAVYCEIFWDSNPPLWPLNQKTHSLKGTSEHGIIPIQLFREEMYSILTLGINPPIKLYHADVSSKLYHLTNHSR